MTQQTSTVQHVDSKMSCNANWVEMFQVDVKSVQWRCEMSLNHIVYTQVACNLRMKSHMQEEEFGKVERVELLQLRA